MANTIFNRNESPYGPSPKCLKALRKLKSDVLTQYTPGYGNSPLVDFLMKEYGLSKQQIVVDYGAQNLLKIIFDHPLVKEKGILTNDSHYSFYDKYSKHKSIKLSNFSLKKEDNSFVFDLVEIKNKYSESNPGCLLITSPNNWTGNSISISALEEILKFVGHNTLVVLDQAYFGFTDDFERKDKVIADLVKHYPHLIILRTFSKLYGLAGVRIGFALCGDKSSKVLNDFGHDLGFNRISEIVALKALEDKKYYRNVSEKTIQDRELLISEINKMKDIKAFSSDANFVLLEVGDTKIDEVKKVMNDQKVVLGKFVEGGYIRFTVGTKKDVLSFLKSIRKVLQ